MISSVWECVKESDKIVKTIIRLNSNQASITITTPNTHAIVMQERKTKTKQNKTITFNNKKK